MKPQSKASVRVIPELRNYHVATLDAMAPADTYYFEAKYDLVGEIPPHLRRVKPLALARQLVRSDATILEMWEPLWVRLLPTHFLLVAGWKIGGFFRRKRTAVVSYALENNDVRSLLVGNGKAPSAAVELFRLLLGWYVRSVYTTLIYASDASKATYESLAGVAKVPSLVVLNLPRRPPDSPTDASAPRRVVMLARMETRKGIHELIEAWPRVEDMLEHAEVTVIGGGPESEVAAVWASAHPGRRFLGEMDHPKALAEVSRAAVLVLPSVRDGRWREQIGLPIHEALLGGLTVVTTDETGLTPWLRSHGHRVVAVNSIREELALALVDALEHPLDRNAVTASLPTQDGRIVASHKMHEVGAHGA